MYTATLFPPKWNSNERKELVNFWVDRYSRNEIHMSPLEDMTSGGDRLVNAKIIDDNLRRKAFDEQDLKLQEDLQRRFDDPAHPVNIHFNHEMMKLRQEQNNCTGPDIERMNLLINASEECHKNWGAEQELNAKKQELESSNINPRTDKSYNALESRMENSNISLGTSMSSLVNYDKLYDHPLSYQDRNLKENPPSVQEQMSWCARRSNAEFAQERSFMQQDAEDKKFNELKSSMKFEEFYGNGEHDSNKRKENLKNAVPAKLNERVNNIIKDGEDNNIYRTANGENTRNKEDSRINRPSAYVFEEFNNRNKSVNNLNISEKDQLADFNKGDISKYSEKDKVKIPSQEEMKEKSLSRDNYENEKNKLNKDYNQKVIEIGTAEADYKYERENQRIHKRYGPKNEEEEKLFNQLRKEQKEESRKEQEKEKNTLSSKENRWDKMFNKTKEWANDTVSKIKECGNKIKDKYNDLTHKNNKIEKNHNLKQAKSVEQKRDAFKNSPEVSRRPSISNAQQNNIRNNPNTIKNDDRHQRQNQSRDERNGHHQDQKENQRMSRPSINVRAEEKANSEHHQSERPQRPKISDGQPEKPSIPVASNHNMKL